MYLLNQWKEEGRCPDVLSSSLSKCLANFILCFNKEKMNIRSQAAKKSCRRSRAYSGPLWPRDHSAKRLWILLRKPALIPGQLPYQPSLIPSSSLPHSPPTYFFTLLTWTFKKSSLTCAKLSLPILSHHSTIYLCPHGIDHGSKFTFICIITIELTITLMVFESLNYEWNSLLHYYYTYLYHDCTYISSCWWLAPWL